MTIIYLIGAVLFFLVCQAAVGFCEDLRESGQ